MHQLTTKKLRHHRGFTIVELLIVIVVIAILASITIVAYNGIQNRAQNARMLSAFDAYEKAIRMYAINNNGEYPPDMFGIRYFCLGDYPAKSGFDEGVCGYVNLGGGSIANLYQVYGTEDTPSMNDILADYISPVNGADFRVTEAEGDVLGSPATVGVRGIVYESAGNTGAKFTIDNPDGSKTYYKHALFYVIDQGESCGRGVFDGTEDPTTHLKVGQCKIIFDAE